MDKNGLKEFYGNIDACSYVTKGDSDTREVHANFKVVCGLNLAIITKEFEAYSVIAADKYDELVSPDYARFREKFDKVSETKNPEKRLTALEIKYAGAIKTHDTFSAWYADEFSTEEIVLPELVLWPFSDLPEKIAGGYLIAIKEMISDFPEFK